MIGELKSYPEYQDSGVPSFGRVPTNWDIAPLARVTRQKMVVGQTDRQLLSVYLNRGVVKFADVDAKRTNATSEDLSLYQAVDPGDFVLNNQQAWRGSVGVSTYSGIVSPAYFVLKLSDRYLPKYADLLFREQSMVAQYLVCSKGVGTIQRNLYWPHLKRIGVIVPPPGEQAAIVRFLSWANRRLEKAMLAKRKVIALLNEQKQAIIYRTVIRGLAPSMTLKPSGVDWLDDIPKHWDVVRTCHLFRQVTRFDPRGDEPKMSMSSRLGLVRSNELSNKAAQAATSIRYSVCIPGDLIVNKYQAHNGLFGAASERGLITSNYSVFKPAIGVMTQYFALLFACFNYRHEFRRRCQGVGDGMMPLYSSAFLKTPAVLPPKEEQLGIVASIAISTRQINQAINRLEREIDLLQEYRACLIRNIVTGKLDVRDAAARLPGDATLEAAEASSDLSDDFEAAEEDAIA